MLGTRSTWDMLYLLLFNASMSIYRCLRIGSTIQHKCPHRRNRFSCWLTSGQNFERVCESLRAVPWVTTVFWSQLRRRENGYPIGVPCEYPMRCQTCASVEHFPVMMGTCWGLSTQVWQIFFISQRMQMHWVKEIFDVICPTVGQAMSLFPGVQRGFRRKIWVLFYLKAPDHCTSSSTGTN